MKILNRICRCIAVGALSYSGLALSCFLWPAPPAGNGGAHHDARKCVPGMNTAWGSANLQKSIIEPNCGYSVTAAGEVIPFHFYVTGPNGSFFPGSNVLFYSDYDVRGVLNVSGSGTFATDPSNSSQQRVDLSGLMGGGYGVPPTTLPFDSADFQTNTIYGNADGWIKIPGVVDATASSILGSNSALVGRSTTWEAYPYWDTTFYSFKWRVNGADVSGATGAFYSTIWNTPGIDTVSAVVVRSSGKADTVIFPVSNTFSVTLNGPTRVTPPGGDCNWTAIANGGAGTVTYQWKWDGANSGTGTSFSHNVSGTSHSLSVSLTDSYSNNASANRTITLGSGGVSCVQ